jgi:RHS repeat-associated protein
MESHLTKFVDNTSDIYLYDGDGKRVKKNATSVTLFWYGATGRVLEETAGNGTLVSEYIFFNGKRIARRDADNTVKFYFSDNLGSASVITDSQGDMPPLAESDYYPYGGEISITSGESNHDKFIGKERDSESGLDSMGARYFGSSLGRFMQADPIYIARHRMIDPQLFNLYQYGRNNPLRYTDVTGLDVTVDCNQASQGECSSIVTQLNQREGKQFDVNRNDKTGLLEAKVDPSVKLSSAESALYNAINDTSHHATLEVVSQSDFVQFGRFDGNGHNTVDASDLKLLSNVSQQTAGGVIAHEALEAFDSTFGNVGYGIAHGYASQFFPEAKSQEFGRCDICNPAFKFSDWVFGGSETFQVKTILTPVPDASRYAYEPGKIVEVKKEQQ